MVSSMLFDSPRMQHLRRKYVDVYDCEAPRVVLLDRLNELEGERKYLEDLYASADVPQPKRNDWKGRLLSDNEGQHLGAWFEMMLCGWLRDVGPVSIAPGTA